MSNYCTDSLRITSYSCFREDWCNHIMYSVQTAMGWCNPTQLFRRWWWCGKVYETRWNESLALGQNADPPGSVNPEFVDQTPSPDILLPNSLFSLQSDQYINLFNPKPIPCLVPSLHQCPFVWLHIFHSCSSASPAPAILLSLPLSITVHFFQAGFSHRGMLTDFINPSLALSLFFPHLRRVEWMRYLDQSVEVSASTCTLIC